MPEGENSRETALMQVSFDKAGDGFVRWVPDGLALFCNGVWLEAQGVWRPGWVRLVTADDGFVR